MTDESSVPATIVDLMERFIAGLRAAGYSQGEISAEIDSSVIAQRDAMQADPARWAQAAFLGSEGVRSRYAAAVGGIEGELTFEDAAAYFARDAKALPDGPASQAMLDMMHEIAIVRAMEARGIAPD